MAETKSVQSIWRTRESGLVVPDGTLSDLSVSSSLTYLQIKEKALELEQLYADSGAALPATSDLARLIADAKELSDSWLIGQVDKLPMTVLFRVGLLDRITSAILPLRAVAERNSFLDAMASGSLDLLDRKRSRAKDMLWELEFWSTLKRRSFDAVLEEPPDIVVSFEDLKLGIACKKLYSERHVQNVLSQAVAQIESNFDFGIVAVNIDDLLPANQILRTPTQKAMAQHVNGLNNRFLQSHERHFRKYLSSGRLISAFISTGVLVDIYRARTRFNNVRQSTVWTIPGLALDKEHALKRFYGRLMG
jgi:hypothetical protein